MTCYVDPASGDVFDHQGNAVGSISDWDGSWSGDFPDSALELLCSAVNESDATGYSQRLIAEMAAEKIEMGTP